MKRLKENKYVLDEEKHELHNIETGIIVDLPSTTAIVNEVYPFPIDKIDPKILEMSQQKGTCVHKMLELHVNGELGTCSHPVRSHFREFLNGKRFIDKLLHKLTPESGWQIQTEKIMVGKQYTGISDFVAYNFETKTLVIYDWKTTKSPHEDKEAMQAVLYAMLFEETEELLVNSVILGIKNTNVDNDYRFDREQLEQARADAKFGLEQYYSE